MATEKLIPRQNKEKIEKGSPRKNRDGITRKKEQNNASRSVGIQFKEKQNSKRTKREDQRFNGEEGEEKEVIHKLCAKRTKGKIKKI